MPGGRPTNEPNNYFAVGLQGAKDTEATNFYFFKHLDGTGFEPEPAIQSEREGGDGQEVGLRYLSFIKADGQVVANSRANGGARMFAYVLGQDSASIIATTPDALGFHRLTPVASLPYLTVEQRYVDIVERVINAGMTTVRVEGEAGRPWKITSDFVGGGSQYARAVASALTPTRETGLPHFFPNGSYVIDGAGNAKITKFAAEIRRGVDEGIQTTGLTREDVVALTFDANLDFTVKYEDPDLYNKIQYGSGTVVPINLATGSFNAVSKTDGGSSMARLCFPVFDYVDIKLNKLDPDGKTVYADVAAMSKKTATTPVFAEYTNTIIIPFI